MASTANIAHVSCRRVRQRAIGLLPDCSHVGGSGPQNTGSIRRYSLRAMPSIYRITYPNGKIYIGKDSTDTVSYFGSVNVDLIHADFPPEETLVFTVKKEILFRSESPEEVSRREGEFIRENRSNDPQIGYNRWPSFDNSQA